MTLPAATLVVPALVTAVTDGDTLRVKASPWLPGYTVETSVRVRGIDTPELPSHASCTAEGELGTAARAVALLEFLGQPVALIAVAPDKYGDRVLATVQRTDGVDWAGLMLAKGLAHPYDGGTKAPWCP